MKTFTKIFTDYLDHCYAVMRLQAQGRDFLIVASEEDAPCYAYDLDDNLKRIPVWGQMGGTMTLVQIAGTLDFLATQRFYPGFNAQNCRIVKLSWNGQGWEQSTMLPFPYLHRFDLVKQTDGRNFWFIGCTIAKTKSGVDDWSDPGQIIVGEYDVDSQTVKDLYALDFRLTKNHGYKKMQGYSLITGSEGIFKLIWPSKGQYWELKPLLSCEVSDVAVSDINGDGKPEYLTIEGFHGPNLKLYNSEFDLLHAKMGQTPFGHALWGADGYFIFGYRDGNKDLVMFDNENLVPHLIDTQVGPSNVLLYKKENQQYLFLANREANQVALYQIGDDRSVFSDR